MFRCYFLNKEWFIWSWLGSALVLLGTWFQVSINVRINQWFGNFYNAIQNALTHTVAVEIDYFYSLLFDFLGLAGLYVLAAVLLTFFTKHWTFRWRTALNAHYLRHWKTLRTIEGASQRIQEDTMRFAVLLENLGSSFIDSLFTLIAFLPILWGLSSSIHEVPLLGKVDHALVYVAILFAIFGTVSLSLVGWKLPGLEFQNQRVEAAFRKELVYAEDHQERGEMGLLKQLFQNIQKNYFTLYFHYLYFDVVKYSYLQISVLIPYLVLAPTIIAGTITLGVLQQIVRAFQQVESSFQFLVRSWSTLVELTSVYKRLKGFEKQIHLSSPAQAIP